MTGKGIKPSEKKPISADVFIPRMLALNLELQQELFVVKSHTENVERISKDIEKLMREENERNAVKKQQPKESQEEEEEGEEQQEEEEEGQPGFMPTNPNNSKTPHPSPTHTKNSHVVQKMQEQKNQVLKVKLSGGENKVKFDGNKGQKFIERKLSTLYPGRIEWASSGCDFVVTPNDVPKPSNSSNSKLKASGRYMVYDQFIEMMNGNPNYISKPKIVK